MGKRSATARALIAEESIEQTVAYAMSSRYVPRSRRVLCSPTMPSE
jgi:hypothetical protein